MVERAGLTDADIERRLKLVELAVAEAVTTNLQLIVAFDVLDLEKTNPEIAKMLSRSHDRLLRVLQDLFEVAAPEAALRDLFEEAAKEGQDV